MCDWGMHTILISPYFVGFFLYLNDFALPLLMPHDLFSLFFIEVYFFYIYIMSKPKRIKIYTI